MRDKMHMSRAVDVSGVAKVLKFSEEGEGALADAGVEHSELRVVIESDEVEDTPVTMELQDKIIESPQRNEEVILFYLFSCSKSIRQ